MYSKEDKVFAAEFLAKAEEKLKIMAPHIGANFPSTPDTTGIWDPTGKTTDISNWMCAFWPGMMWLMHIKTGDEMYKSFAEECEKKLDEALDVFENLSHDVGFVWGLTALANYKITGNEKSRARALHAATILAGRFNHKCGFIRALNGSRINWAIIDCMMNIPLLFWASRETNDPRFEQIAVAHADTVMKHFVRPDGSVNHIVEFDLETGEVADTPRGQGFASGSSWSRGQSWALYGFVLAYLNSGKREYLDTAKRVAHYVIANLEPDKLPLLDFRAPSEPVYYDSSAAAIFACGLIEIAKAVPEYESKIYARAAMQLLRVLDKNCNYNQDEIVFLENGSSAYHRPQCMHVPLIYGDYYLLEALMKLYGNDGEFSVHK